MFSPEQGKPRNKMPNKKATLQGKRKHFVKKIVVIKKSNMHFCGHIGWFSMFTTCSYTAG